MFCHVYRKESWDTDDIYVLAAALDAYTMHELGANPTIQRFLGAFGLYAAANGAGDLLVSYPDVDTLTERIREVSDTVPAYNPPAFKAFEGDNYSAHQFLTALTDGSVLVSTQKEFEHDMVQHTPAWLAMPPAVFSAFQRRAEHILLQDCSVSDERYQTPGGFMGAIDGTIGTSPIISHLMIDPAKQPWRGWNVAFMDTVMGAGSGGTALYEIGEYARFVGGELA